jgi:hypothetical protein
MPVSFTAFQPIVINLVIGNVATTFPNPLNPDGTRNEKLSRLWLSIQTSRSVPSAVGDKTQIVLNKGTVGIVLSQHQPDVVGLLLANDTVAHIGQNIFRKGVGAAGAAGLHYSMGRKPILVSPKDSLLINSGAAAAVGTEAVSGLFVDIPASAILPLDYLA